MRRRRDDPNQTFINWSNPVASAVAPRPSFPDPVKLAAAAPAPLVQYLPWDFTTTFPQPTDEALETGRILDEDNHPENIKAIHDEHAREALATLHDLDAVLDARRRGVDPSTGKPPRTHASRERLRQFLEKEPNRLELHFNNLMEVYEDAFGPQAADAFTKFLRATHAGIKVEIAGDASTRKDEEGSAANRGISQETSPAHRQPRRSPVVLPAPKPLPEAIKAGHFGKQENGKPVHPSPREVRAITEQHAEKIIDLLDALRQAERHFARGSDEARTGAECVRLKNEIKTGIDKYAASFGPEAGERLEAYCRRQASAQQRGRC